MPRGKKSKEESEEEPEEVENDDTNDSDVSEKEESEIEEKSESTKKKVDISHILWTVSKLSFDIKRLSKIQSNLNDIEQNLKIETTNVPNRTTNMTLVQNYSNELDASAVQLQMQINSLIQYTSELLGIRESLEETGQQLRTLRPTKKSSYCQISIII